MKKWVCTVCGYVYEGPEAPEICPVCKAPKEKFAEQSGDRAWAAEHVVGVAQGAPEEIIQGLRDIFCLTAENFILKHWKAKFKTA